MDTTERLNWTEDSGDSDDAGDAGDGAGLLALTVPLIGVVTARIRPGRGAQVQMKQDSSRGRKPPSFNLSKMERSLSSPLAVDERVLSRGPGLGPQALLTATLYTRACPTRRSPLGLAPTVFPALRPRGRLSVPGSLGPRVP